MKIKSIRHAGFESRQRAPGRKCVDPGFPAGLPRAPLHRAPPSPLPSSAATWDGRFSGHPLTLDLVDLPLVDFFRLMAQEGGINVVIDPEIKGSISIKVVKLPWDQIFEAVLLNHGLDKHVEGNLVRIATKLTLQEEAQQRESLKTANLLAADLETRIKRLNYAKAATFVAALTDQKTVRGTVVVDERTNSLILTDIPPSLDKMIELVESLDIPQPQVEIEARIVSAIARLCARYWSAIWIRSGKFAAGQRRWPEHLWNHWRHPAGGHADHHIRRRECRERTRLA